MKKKEITAKLVALALCGCITCSFAACGSSGKTASKAEKSSDSKSASSVSAKEESTADDSKTTAGNTEVLNAWDKTGWAMTKFEQFWDRDTNIKYWGTDANAPLNETIIEASCEVPDDVKANFDDLKKIFSKSPFFLKGGQIESYGSYLGLETDDEIGDYVQFIPGVSTLDSLDTKNRVCIERDYFSTEPTSYEILKDYTEYKLDLEDKTYTTETFPEDYDSFGEEVNPNGMSIFLLSEALHFCENFGDECAKVEMDGMEYIRLKGTWRSDEKTEYLYFRDGVLEYHCGWRDEDFDTSRWFTGIHYMNTEADESLFEVPEGYTEK